MIRRRESGQATVELALALPVLLGLVILILQAAMVARVQVLVVQAAREGARVAALQGDIPAAQSAARAATGLDSRRLTVDVSLPGRSDGSAVVNATYRIRVGVPLLGIEREIALHSALAMRREY